MNSPELYGGAAHAALAQTVEETGDGQCQASKGDNRSALWLTIAFFEQQRHGVNASTVSQLSRRGNLTCTIAKHPGQELRFLLADPVAV